jgi:hypothetical protein
VSCRAKSLGRLELAKSIAADQLPHPALQLIAARSDLFSRLGSVVSTWSADRMPAW